MNFFIDRPVFASAIALIMIMAGAISMMVLPIAQFPPLVPPQVQLSTQYLGAGSDVVSKTVTTPLEEQLTSSAGMKVNVVAANAAPPEASQPASKPAETPASNPPKESATDPETKS